MQTQEIIQQQRPKVKGVSDIVFCIDVTGSMEPCLDGLINNLKSFVDNLGEANVTVDWRARILPYKDLDVDENALDNSFPFVSTAGELKAQLESLSAEGGGDAPESTLDALYIAATKSEWRAPAHHFIVLFTDAVPKEQLHPSTIEPGQDPSINTVIHALTMNKIKLFAWTPNHSIYEELKKVPKAHFTPLGPPEDLKRYEGLRNQDFRKLLEWLAKTVTQSSIEKS
jgi:hypothetical protein